LLLTIFDIARDLAPLGHGTSVDQLAAVPGSSTGARRPRESGSRNQASDLNAAIASERVSVAARWRRDRRKRALQKFAAQAADLRWSGSLLHLLIEELGVEEEFAALLGEASEVSIRNYPQAVAVAVALRHSWRADSLAAVIERILDTTTRTKPRRFRR
jgi:hypothetical protein